MVTFDTRREPRCEPLDPRIPLRDCVEVDARREPARELLPERADDFADRADPRVAAARVFDPRRPLDPLRREDDALPALLRDDVDREFFDLDLTAICTNRCNRRAFRVERKHYTTVRSRDCKFLHRMWGIIPAAGKGSRIQPLAFSKELLPVGSRSDADGSERPRAVSEYLIERMLLAGVDKFCFVISPGKSDILEYYGGRIAGADVCYVVQSQPAGLCDALFCARPLIQPQDSIVIGLPDTIWFPRDGLARLPLHTLSFLLFPVAHPELFDAVVADAGGEVRKIQVKQNNPASHWVWGAFRLPGDVYLALHDIWEQRRPRDEYFGTLVNAYLEQGGRAAALRAGEVYVDVGTVHGYREALRALHQATQESDDAGRLSHSGSDSTEGSRTRTLVP